MKFHVYKLIPDIYYFFFFRDLFVFKPQVLLKYCLLLCLRKCVILFDKL